ncbi:MAG: hypothetical protein CFE21_05695 [Bacteroidetes bacterium B1(2017)]|nr:MAG: hypothetical protein CFE21_05695 [Bacteroidetes bacterium B1(2017)]
MKKYILSGIIALALFLVSAPSLFAQPGFDDDVSDAPIDGGIALLVGAGIAFGFKKKVNEEN